MAETKELTTRTHLWDDFYLCRDTFNLWISKQIKSKDGKEYYKRITGYYGTYEALFDGYVKYTAKDVKGDEVAELLKNLKTIEKDLRKLAKSLAKEEE